ncbi:MAG TPA: tetratricopeptide repeat protein, partial [Anaerolineae bacterium]|nr:tetratricopeptide repeat protein [Anaerolineae bacterium]
MAEVALQAYENEIDQMIEEARYLEALAHLRHILGRYPRYLNAYYLLGKMLLEADLPDLAVDMFRRVLNADPEHFLARIGLGLAHERRGQLQAAIWNLQQAFDLAPGDEAIHDELCRLMGQDSGVTPDHIPMSRAGLARLYLRGGLFNRAVEEFRTLVAENPDRVDLQVALAEAYWRDDQIVLAAEQCQRILDVFPYCLKANLLLGTLLQNSGQESGGRYLQRAQEVDPENQVAEALFGSSSPWPKTTKTIERLLYDPAALDVDQKARWFHDLETASVSVGISEALPQMSQAEMQLVDVTASLESQIEIPDWLRELTPLEELAEGESPEEPAEAEVAEPESTIGYEDLASWLQPTRPSVAPEPTPPAAEAVLGPTAEEEIPDWLRSLQPAGPAAIPPRPSDEGVGEEALPDWLTELQLPAAAEAAAPAAQPAEAEELFGWDAFAGAPTEAAAAAGEEALEELPEWLAELQPPAAAETAAPAAQPAEAEELFGWDAFAGA